MAQQQQFALLLVTIPYLVPLHLLAEAVVVLIVFLQVEQTMTAALAALVAAAELAKVRLEMEALGTLHQQARLKDQMAEIRYIKQARLQHTTAAVAVAHLPQELPLRLALAREMAAQVQPQAFLVRLQLMQAVAAVVGIVYLPIQRAAQAVLAAAVPVEMEAVQVLRLLAQPIPAVAAALAVI